VNCGRTAEAQRVMLMRRLRVFVWLAEVNSTRATTAFVPRRSEEVRRLSVQRPSAAWPQIAS